MPPPLKTRNSSYWFRSAIFKIELMIPIGLAKGYGQPMPIRRYIDPNDRLEVVKAMVEAFAIARKTLNERGLHHISTQAIAKKISALAHEGETDPKRLAELALPDQEPLRERPNEPAQKR